MMRMKFATLLLLCLGTLSGAFVPLSPLANHGEKQQRKNGQVVVPMHYGSNSFVYDSYKYDHHHRSLLSLSASSSSSQEDDDEDTSFEKWKSNNLIFATLWVGFLLYGIVFSPGEFFAVEDTAIINGYIQNPVNPGFNEIFLLIFSSLGVLPASLAGVALPQGSKKGLPALPFAIASYGAGFGAWGAYLSFRAPPKEEIISSEEDVGWFTRNVIENKLFSVGVLFLFIETVWSSGLIQALQDDATGVVNGYIQLVSSSKLASVSTLDAIIFNIAIAALIPKDYKLRIPDADDSKTTWISLSTLLLPCFGSVLYLLLRPPLPSSSSSKQEL